MNVRRNSKHRVINSLDAAKDELREAERAVKRNQFEKAEKEVADSLRFISRALRRINKIEKGS
ncbi:hypothetical protein ACFQZT_28975 [Paenibacillus sp. GCM10027628]|uniref:hypothetical protein n=1 Tax=Paenibacillus sp. GCM10027628 TaxID=3273413 RepID=UPI00363B4B3D